VDFLDADRLAGKDGAEVNFLVSQTFIARTIAAFGLKSMLRMVPHLRRPQSRHITCYINRTYQCANDMPPSRS
jgi:hypothetical protein